MRSTKRIEGVVLFLAALLIGSLLFACGGRQPSRFEGKTLYAQANFFVERNQMSALNYRKAGAPIPIGAKVHVVAANREIIRFTVDSSGAQYSFVTHRSLASVPIDRLFDGYFGPEDPAAKLAQLNPEEQQNVRAVKIEPGMSKQAVLLSAGLPPFTGTPTLEANTWVYWNGRTKKFTVDFGPDGRVVGQAAPAPAPAAAPQPTKEIRYATCNVHFEENEINWINYLSGPVIKLNSRIEILKKDEDQIKFRVLDTGIEYKFVNEAEKSGSSTWELFAKLFDTADQRPRLEALTAEEKANAAGAEVEAGMSKQAVLMAWCPPPTNKTPSTEAKKWTYWKNRFNTVTIQFDRDGKVSKLSN